MNRSISFSSFYKYLKKNIKKPHRLTDLCEYCEYGKILEKDTNLNPEESNLLQAIKIHRQFANSQQDLYKFQTSNEDFLKENIVFEMDYKAKIQLSMLIVFYYKLPADFKR
jgi:hypothetical protein